MENRHAGSWSLLANPEYWGRFFTWVAAKGVGIPLFVFWAWKLAKMHGVASLGRAERTLVFWSLGLLPYWIFVRQGNYVHDYYFLVFFVPLALLGARGMLTLRNRYALLAIGLVNVAIGLTQPWRMNKMGSDDPQAQRSAFCGIEKGKDSLP